MAVADIASPFAEASIRAFCQEISFETKQMFEKKNWFFFSLL
jgi:hypothetical protein